MVEILDILGRSIPVMIVAVTGFVSLFVKQKTAHKKMKNVDSKVEAAIKSVTNDHPEHIRDDMDKKHNNVVEIVRSLQRSMDKRFDILEERESIMLERVGHIEAHANDEHRNIWKAISSLRRNRNER